MRLCLLVCALWLVGCFDADPSGGEALPADASPIRCEALPLAVEEGRTCTRGTSACGEGAECVLDAWSGESRCRQQCVPGTCEEACAAGERCALPWSPEGRSPSVFDLNGDGVAESSVGVCRAEASEPAGLFAMCGSDPSLALNRGCDAGGLCARFFAASVAGTCLPPCESDCAVVDGYVPSCFDVGDSVRRCLLECSDELYSSDCPRGMVCRPVQEGFALCVR